MADDAASLVVQIRADQTRFQREMSKVARDAARAADRVEKGFTSANARAGNSFSRIGSSAQNAFRQAERGVQSYSSKLDQISRKMETLSSRGAGIGALAGSFAGGLIGGAVAALSVRELTQLTDASTRVTNALKVAGLEGDNLTQTYNRLGQTAIKNGANFESLAVLFARVTQSSKELGVTQQQTEEFVRRMAVGLRASGTDSQQASDGIRQLTQALASGLLRGDEFNSVMENLPVVARAIAKGLGVSIGELRKMAEAGQLTAKTVFDAFIKGSSDFDAQAEKTQMTFSQAWEAISTALIMAAGKFNDATGAAEGFANFVTTVLVPAIESAGNAIAKTTGLLKSFTEFSQKMALGGAQPIGETGSAIADVVTAAADAMAEVSRNVDSLQNDILNFVSTVGPSAREVGDSFETLQTSLKNGSATVEDFDAAIAALRATGDETAKQYADQLAQMRAGFEDVAKAAREQAQPAVENLRKAIADDLGRISQDVLTRMADQFGDKLPKSVMTFIEALKAAGEEVNRMNEALAQGGEGRSDFLSAQTDNAAFLGSGRAFPASKDRQSAADFIKQKESFSRTAYLDSGRVRKYRAGFGSDTFVDAAGNIQKVTKDTVVTIEQATADLDRRLGEFQATIVRQIGPDFWKSLDKNQQTALSSIAYNYGSLPDKIVKVINSGASRGEVAKAINALGTDNNGINAKRRTQEAELFGGTDFSAGSTKQANKDLDEWIVKSQQALELKQKENLIDKDMTATTNEKSAAKEKEKFIQEGLNAVQAQFGTISEENRAKVIAMAEAMSQAGLASDVLKDKQKASADQAKQNADAVAHFNEQMAGIAKTAFSGFINDLRNGKSAGEAFANMLDRVVDGLINMAIEALFSKNALGSVFGGGGAAAGGGGGLGGLIGKIFGVGMHKGGTVGRDATFARAVPRTAFVGAKRYRQGGVAGFAPGEVPAILHKGEVVIPKGAKAGAASTTNNVANNVAIRVDSQGNASLTKDEGVGLGKRLNLVVQEEIARQQRVGGLLAGTGPGRHY